MGTEWNPNSLHEKFDKNVQHIWFMGLLENSYASYLHHHVGLSNSTMPEKKILVFAKKTKTRAEQRVAEQDLIFLVFVYKTWLGEESALKALRVVTQYCRFWQ